MKRVLILLAVLGLAATPVMAATKLEASHVQKHARVKHQTANKHQKKHLKKKLTKRSTRKQKTAV